MGGAVIETDLEKAGELEAAGKWSEAPRFYRKLLASGLEGFSRAEVLLQLAGCLLETCKRGQVDDAADCLAEAQRDILASGDKALEGRFRLQQGRLDEQQGNLRRALERYVMARDLLSVGGAELSKADLMLASVERRRGELKKALERLERIELASLSDPMRADYFDELGAVQLARGDASSAVETLKHALELDQSGTNEFTAGRSQLLLAEAYVHQGMRLKAKQLIDNAIRAYDREHAEAGLSEAYALMGQWYEEGEDFASAAHFYKESFDLDRNSDDAVGQARAKRYLGRAFRKKGDSYRAQEFFDEARALLPRDDDVEMAALLTEEGYLALVGSEPNYAEAIEHFRRALEIAVEDGDERAVAVAKRNVAKALRESNDLRGAEQLLLEARPALEERGDLRELDDLLDDLGEVLLEQDRYQEALECLQASLELDDRIHTVGSQGRSLLLVGRTYLQLGDRQRAGKAFKDALDVYRGAENEVGESEALHELGSWYAEEGKLNEAIRAYRDGLAIDHRLNDRVGVVRVKRSLAAAYRRRGDLARAEEMLDEAEHDLRPIDDKMEQALLTVERGRMGLAQGRYREAREHLQSASRVFEGGSSAVQMATCQRLLANAATAEGNYARALDLLDQAKQVFEAANDAPELDQLFDDLGSVYLLSGRLEEAEVAVNQSLEIGQRMGWDYGNGRSLLLLGRIMMQRGDMTRALKEIQDARITFERSNDEVGLSDAYLHLGDWYATDKNPDRDFTRAASAYKHARRLDQLHRDLRGMGRCNRKLAHVYRLSSDFERADEALEQSEDNLRGVDDMRELAPLELEKGALHAARGEHVEAIRYFRRALSRFKDLSQGEEVIRTYQLLVTSHQSLGQVREALECMREMGLEHATMWNILVKDLHPLISGPSHPSFAAGAYSDAISAGFSALEREFRSRAANPESARALGTEPISQVIRAWLASGRADVPQFSKSKTLERFSDFCVASFEIIRNSAVHESVRLSAVDAFSSLAVAHVIATTIGSRAGNSSDPITPIEGSR
jgi:tetratricopeptide (TPR) repeat protein